MSIIGIERLVYRVDDVAKSASFFDDFGLCRDETAPDSIPTFLLPEGSRVVIRHLDDPALPSTRMVGAGVCEVVWGVSDLASQERLVSGLQTDRKVDVDADGTARFATDFGVPMALRVFDKKHVVTAPDPQNSPGRINRLNIHRKWRLRALPKGISHVVFNVPDYEAGYVFMRDRLGFRMTDSQRGFGKYLRAPGSNAHHALLLLNANAPLPGQDGKVRFDHTNFAVEDIDEIMVGANYMARRGWEPSHMGLGRHRVDSALFYYIPCPAGGEAEYGADQDAVDDGWVPRDWIDPLFGVAQYVSNIPPFLLEEPEWKFEYITTGHAPHDARSSSESH